MRIAYGDPPYPGQSLKHYGDHPDYAGEVDHAALIAQLADYDAWVLHTSSSALRDVLALCPPDVRVGAWVKPFCAWKRGVYPAYCWEPVLFHGKRSLYGERETPRDYISEGITLQRGVAGAKPEAVCWWVFDCLGAQEGDELHDLFPEVRMNLSRKDLTPPTAGHTAATAQPSTEGLNPAVESGRGPPDCLTQWTLEQAIAAAARLHAGQVDKQGEVYILHPLRVMQAVSPKARVVAVLHDVLEDTAASREWIATKVTPVEFVALLHVTRHPTEAYCDFIDRIQEAEGMAGHIAREVKIADVKDNLERLTPELASLRRRYIEALPVLEAAMLNA